MNSLVLPLGMMLVFINGAATSGVLDPDCTAEKAAKSAAAKATVGVGGRCSPKETAADSAKVVVGIENKGSRRKAPR